MAKRHSYPEDRLYLRVQDIDAILATGQGISRVPAKQADPFKLPRRPSEPEPRVYTPKHVDIRHWQEVALTGQQLFMPTYGILVDVPGRVIVEFFEAPSAQTEIDMSQYRHLVKERNWLLREIEAHVQRRLFPGWTAPRHLPSPFGPDWSRFRTFDPTPAFEFVAGPLRHIGW